MTPSSWSKQQVKQVTDEPEQQAAGSLFTAAGGLKAGQTPLPSYDFFPGRRSDFQADLGTFPWWREPPRIESEQVLGVLNFRLGFHGERIGIQAGSSGQSLVYPKVRGEGSFFFLGGPEAAKAESGRAP
jgi:hypothetical protein